MPRNRDKSTYTSPPTPPPPTLTERDWSKLAPLWYALLLIGLGLSTWYALAQAWRVEEFPQAVDSFGYQHMAQAMREARAAGTQPNYTFDDPRAREVVGLLKSQNVPMEKWQTFVAPQAFHYHAGTDSFIIQYPPGVGLGMAMFPRGRSLWPINLLQVGAIVVAGLVGLALAWRNKNHLAAGAVAMTTTFALGFIGTTVSYSIDMIGALIPIAIACAAGASFTKRVPLAVVLSAVAGAAFGYAILCRITIVFLLPGMVVLLWPIVKRQWVTVVSPFVLMAVVCGVWPQLLHQKRLTGHYLESTYSQIDAAAPSLSYIPQNVPNYFATPESFSGNYALLVLMLSVGVLVYFSERTPQVKRLLLGAVALFVLPTAYFLIHKVATFYYQLPGILAACGALTVAALAARPRMPEGRAKLFSGGAAMVAGVVAIGLACVPPIVITHSAPLEERQWSVPEPLKDPQAIIYGERFTGTLWHFNRIAAFDITHTDADTALLVMRHFHGAGRPQYVLYDNNNLKTILTELVKRGVVFKEAGFKLEHRQVLQVQDVRTPTTR